MKIGVSGASGHLGKTIVSELLRRAAGHEVIAISRTPETVAGPAQGRLGDYDQPDGLRKPMLTSIVSSSFRLSIQYRESVAHRISLPSMRQ